MKTQMMLKITVLVDNQSESTYAKEHGLALLLDFDGEQTLFDTGQAEALSHNIAEAKVQLCNLKNLILSHGHYDHSGNLSMVLSQAPQVQLFYGTNIEQKRFSFHPPAPPSTLTMPQSAIDAWQNHPVEQRHEVKKFTAVNDFFYLTGPILRQSFEDCGGAFFHDESGKLPDHIEDEIALLTRNGVLIQGCCHAGIINTLEHCAEHAGQIHIHTIIGGLHLQHSSRSRLQETVDYLNQKEVQKLILLHCTGENAIAFLKENFKGTVVAGHSGAVFYE